MGSLMDVARSKWLHDVFERLCEPGPELPPCGPGRRSNRLTAGGITSGPLFRGGHQPILRSEDLAVPEAA